MCGFRAQGATEYLVLLAVVLIIALVSITLLGSFPGTSADNQITQSKAYWQSAAPVSIVDASAKYTQGWGAGSEIALRFKNSGGYAIRITRLIGGRNNSISSFWCQHADCGGAGVIRNISDFYYLAPGEEKTLKGSAFGGQQMIISMTESANTETTTTYNFFAAKSKCRSPVFNNNMTQFLIDMANYPNYEWGTLEINDFGFEYMMYIEGVTITKRQIGKPLLARCINAAWS